MCTRNDIDAIVKKIIATYHHVYGDKLMAVYLYGSYARKDYDEHSDVDIVAIVDGERKYVQNQLKRIWDKSSELELEYEVIISPTAIPYNDFTTYGSVLPYYRNISTEGVRLYESA